MQGIFYLEGRFANYTGYHITSAGSGDMVVDLALRATVVSRFWRIDDGSNFDRWRSSTHLPTA